jgi:hypothetical protein
MRTANEERKIEKLSALVSNYSKADDMKNEKIWKKAKTFERIIKQSS